MISPYTINIPDEQLATIRTKVEAYDWSQLPDAGGWSAGVGVDDLKRLAAYWLDSYDWRAVERRLNALPNFTADVEGEHLHFVHVKGDGSSRPSCFFTSGRARISSSNGCWSRSQRTGTMSSSPRFLGSRSPTRSRARSAHGGRLRLCMS